MPALQPESITRGFGALRTAATLLAVARLLSGPADAQSPEPPAAGWRASPAHVALFTPPRHGDAYQAFVSSEPFDQALAGLLAAAPAVRGPGLWEPQRVAATDAFGAGAPYNRWQLVRLYGARGPRVARGPVGGDGRPPEMWTLVSPYPDATLNRLEPGTLLLVLRIP